MKIALIATGALFLDIYEEMEMQGYTVVGYMALEENSRVDLPYLGNQEADPPKDVRTFVTLGGIGRKIIDRSRLHEMHKKTLVNLVFHDAHVSKYAYLEPNSGIFVMSGTIIRSNVHLEANTFINALCNLGHDVHVRRDSQISNGVLMGGKVTVGERCFIGQGANIFEGVDIGEGSLIAANALVTKDVPCNSLVINKDEIRPLDEWT